MYMRQESRRFERRPNSDQPVMWFISSRSRSRRLSTGIIPIIFARRIALPILRWFFQVSFVSLRPLILPMDVTKRDMSDEFWHSFSGSRSFW